MFDRLRPYPAVNHPNVALESAIEMSSGCRTNVSRVPSDVTYSAGQRLALLVENVIDSVDTGMGLSAVRQPLGWCPTLPRVAHRGDKAPTSWQCALLGNLSCAPAWVNKENAPSLCFISVLKSEQQAPSLMQEREAL